MARSLNKVQLIGNLTRDPELRYTPNGAAVVSFSVATSRNWTTETGEKREEADFHRIIAWNKLAELCSQLLTKGRKVYVEGRLSTRSWTGQDGTQKSTTEVVIDNMILLDSKRTGVEEAPHPVEEPKGTEGPKEETKIAEKKAPIKAKEEKKDEDDDIIPSAGGNQEVSPDDIPF